ncbi:SpoIIE family protein phosphatase [Actinomadura sp. ATCC 31491]|uniref:SpoIIE family protein phosphatase n=1 Tax=Actinomadura luzonensis TaxID=2805427 RepID=A0ABT0FJ44_9ACTN|nr:GAF domain-containing SpoIIE family protein phosphatase [Actinomadura luzonensis]MCK2212330.1 SpoIIE family protein phosphatase [Actinomadura luzonensis]
MGLDIHEYLSVLSEVSSAMTSSLDADTALRRLCRILVPRMADWCAADLVEGDSIRRVSVAASGAGRRPAYLTDKVGPLPRETEELLRRLLRATDPLLIRATPTAPQQEAPEQEAPLRLPAGGSAIVAPLRVRGNALGALTLARLGPGAPLTDADLPLVTDLAHRAALAVDNTRLYGMQHEMATRLQHAMLPRLPDLGPLRLAAAYLPARESSQVGGDWYDAFRLSDGTPALVIGDVEGHDIAAATQMGEVRNMLRALAFDGREEPSATVSRLDRALAGVGGRLLTTMVLARVEGPAAGRWRMRWTNAGHPGPLLITRDGGTGFLEEGRSALLGLDPALSRADAVTALPPGSTVLFYTDGLIERRTEPLERGMTRLRRRAGALAGADAQTYCDELIALAGAANEDDLALLALQLPEEPG